MTHGDFIFAAYLAAFAVFALLLIWVALDYRALRRTLAELENEGVVRRSAQSEKAAS